jgi:hypothetical protein
VPIIQLGLQARAGREFTTSGRNQNVRDLQSSRMIRKLKSGECRLYSKKTDAKTGKTRNPGTFSRREAAEKHERAVQFFKRAH